MSFQSWSYPLLIKVTFLVNSRVIEGQQRLKSESFDNEIAEEWSLFWVHTVRPMVNKLYWRVFSKVRIYCTSCQWEVENLEKIYHWEKWKMIKLWLNSCLCISYCFMIFSSLLISTHQWTILVVLILIAFLTYPTLDSPCTKESKWLLSRWCFEWKDVW